MQKEEINKLLDLSGKTAIVTGAVGIGFGIAYRLAQAGANVMVATRILKEASDSVQELIEKGWKAKAVQIDVSNEEDVQRMVEISVAEYGSVDILVNNAGIYPNNPLSEMTEEDFEKVIKVNLEGVFLTTKYI